jgi:heme/copper-type cytochrome/quinol oxidase subunit 2
MTSSRYDSYIKPHCILELGDYRALEVDYRAIVPTAIDAILVVTSDDLLHSFTIPTISVKIDAIPARLNARILVIVIPGLYYGQCSELCGVNHSFMPIVIEATSLSSLQLWLILWQYSIIAYCMPNVLKV